jgi:hypothetical protein
MEEIFRALGGPVLVQVAGRTDDDEPRSVGDSKADHVALHVLAQANARVEALADDVHEPIFEHELDLDPRMPLAKLRQHRLEHEFDRCAGHRQSHPADDLACFRGDLRERCVHLRNRRPCGFHEAPCPRTASCIVGVWLETGNGDGRQGRK